MKSNEAVFAVRDYDLAATLGCGQAFRWELREDRWYGVVGENWVALEQRFPSLSPAEGERVRVGISRKQLSRFEPFNQRALVGRRGGSGTGVSPVRFDSHGRDARATTRLMDRGGLGFGPSTAGIAGLGVPPHPNPLPLGGGEGENSSKSVLAPLNAAQHFIHAFTSSPQTDWRWLEDYLQLHVDLPAVLATFPRDVPMRDAVGRCRGLRLLRQDPWECLASFILSSTKQIVQIRQIVALLCARYGRSIAGLDGEAAFVFPRAEQIAALSEAQLRDCKMGFRAPYLLAAARSVAAGELNLDDLGRLELPEARSRLLNLSGVGPKIADCVLLFAAGFPTAFPVDVWVMRALRESYFRNRRVPLARLRRFSATHFGPHGGYAQQYLFHSLRLKTNSPTNRRSLHSGSWTGKKLSR